MGGFENAGHWLALMLPGIVLTVELSAICTVITIAWGIVLAVGAISPAVPLRRISIAVIDVLRSIPILALLFLWYYGLGSFHALNQSPFVIAVCSISGITGAYLADVYRAAFLSVRQGQWEASYSVGLTRSQCVRLVIIPQVVPTLIPATMNQVVAIVKATSLASLITVSEVTLASSLAISESFLPLQVYLLLAAVYVALVTPLLLAVRGVEHLIARGSSFRSLLGLRRFGVPHVARGTSP